jgi:hypothetical protein
LAYTGFADGIDDASENEVTAFVAYLQDSVD